MKLISKIIEDTTQVIKIEPKTKPFNDQVLIKLMKFKSIDRDDNLDFENNKHLLTMISTKADENYKKYVDHLKVNLSP